MRAFAGSMTGRVFIVLLLGMIASAALTQWLSVGERTRAFERYRDFHAMERAEQLITTADALDVASRPTYMRMAERGTIKLQSLAPTPAVASAAPANAATPAAYAYPGATAATAFSTTLQQRLAKGIVLQPLAAPPVECGQPRQSYIFAPSQWGGACEAMVVTLRDGAMLKLSILPPPERPATSFSEFLALLPFLLCVAALAYLVTRMAVRPLKLLAKAAKDLGNDINHPPVVLSGAAEIRQASAAFNAMQARIRQHIMQRTQMLAAITHDLQTPLTRLRLRLEKVHDPELQQRLIDDLSAMQQMVREGLDLARSMDTTETMQALDLDSLLDSVCSDATDSGQPVELRGRAAMALMGRPLDMRRCLVNLIDNAVKYGHHAHVSVERIAGAARIVIRDGGPGIARDQMAHVFEPFYRIESSRSRESGGTGLGLTIARNIAEQHGATLALNNHPEGGLEVTLVVPEYYAVR